MIVITKTPIEVRSYKIGKLALLYGMTYKTFRKKIRRFQHLIGDIVDGELSYHQVLTLFRENGVPGAMVVEETELNGRIVYYREETKTMYILSVPALADAA